VIVAQRPTGEREARALPPAIDSMTLLVAAVIVHDLETNQVLLIQRGPGAKFAPGHWDLPVGKSDPGEAITHTAIRELHEETGLVVDPADLRLAHVIHSSWGVEAPNGFLTVVFVTNVWSGEPVNGEPTKHAQVAWVSTDALPTPFVATTGNALTQYLSDGPEITLDGWV
jgi:8-oxo-dGTP pyrophosphatase MutT (NUDIX family)